MKWFASLLVTLTSNILGGQTNLWIAVMNGSCQGLDHTCSKKPPIPRTIFYLANANLDQDSVFNYTCHYQPSCAQDGSWSMNDMTCLVTPSICIGPPPALIGGTSNYKREMAYFQGMDVNYKCPHYQLKSTCQEDGSWTKMDDKCLSICIEQPPAPPLKGGSSNINACETYRLGMEVSYTCPNYTNPLKSTCTEFGNWTSLTDPECLPICGHLDFSPPGEFTSDYDSTLDYKSGMHVKFTCSFDSLEMLASCDENATWTLPEGRCIPRLSPGERFRLTPEVKCVYIETPNWPNERYTTGRISWTIYPTRLCTGDIYVTFSQPFDVRGVRATSRKCTQDQITLTQVISRRRRGLARTYGICNENFGSGVKRFNSKVYPLTAVFQAEKAGGIGFRAKICATRCQR